MGLTLPPSIAELVAEARARSAKALAERRCYYCYAVYRVADGAVLYIGKGQGGRARQHWQRSHNPALKKALAALGRDGASIEIFADELTEKDAYACERAAIFHYRRRANAALLNRSEGGDGGKSGPRVCGEQTVRASVDKGIAETERASHWTIDAVQDRLLAIWNGQ